MWKLSIPYTNSRFSMKYIRQYEKEHMTDSKPHEIGESLKKYIDEIQKARTANFNSLIVLFSPNNTGIVRTLLSISSMTSLISSRTSRITTKK